MARQTALWRLFLCPLSSGHSDKNSDGQTLDQGAPVLAWTVANQMGHGGRSLVDRVYGHLGEVRHRSEFVEFRLDQHIDQLGERAAFVQQRKRSTVLVEQVIDRRLDSSPRDTDSWGRFV